MAVPLPVRAPHASANQEVKALQLPCGWVGDDDHTNVVGQDVHAVVAWHRHRNLKLAGQELRGMAERSTAQDSRAQSWPEDMPAGLLLCRQG